MRAKWRGIWLRPEKWTNSRCRSTANKLFRCGSRRATAGCCAAGAKCRRGRGCDWRDLAGGGGVEWVSGLPVTAGGDWTIAVGGDAGEYDVRVVVNAGWEEESAGSSNNGTPGAAEDLDGAFAVLAGAGGGCAAAVGRLASGSHVVAADDFESAALGPAWTSYTASAGGRVRVTNEQTAGGGEYALVLDREPGQRHAHGGGVDR